MARRNNNTTAWICLMAVTAFLAASCSSTSNLPEGEQLYIGMKEIDYLDTFTVVKPEQAENKKYRGYDYDNYMMKVKEEVEAALAYAPNGAIFGSAYYRTPLQIRLWTYNAFANSESGFGKWMRNSFGRQPVLVSQVNPETRSVVAQNLLRAYGFFNAKVDNEIINAKNPKMAKVGYSITTGQLYTIDTLKYLNFPHEIDSLIRATYPARQIRSGDPFSASALEAERTRISNLLRNNGYYYYRTEYATYVADSVSTPGKVEVHMQPLANVPDEANRKWYFGNPRVELRRSVGERLADSIKHRFLTVYYAGKKPPIRPRAILRDLKVRRGMLYSQNNVNESSSVLNSLGLFTMSSFTFTPRDTTSTCDTLDMTLNCVLDKPYDGSVSANYSLKSNDRTGPGLVFGLTKRNAFRGGEKLTINLKGSYEWQTGRNVSGSSSKINSYEYGGDISIEYPRIEAPFNLFSRRRFYAPPSTLFSISADVLNRADYFKMLTLTGAVTYKFQTSASSRHEFSPLLLDFNYLQSTTERFNTLMEENTAIYYSMQNKFIPKIKYTYTYTSPSSYMNPISWETSVTEAGNILSLGYMAAGRDFSEKNKDLIGNPYAQFLKISTTLRKTWQTGFKSQLVGRVAGGIIWTYGNSDYTPYSEAFYVGGANSIRAFTVRSIGPGKYIPGESRYSYFDQVGDIKLEANLEYRFNLFGSLNGAVFLDAGNVWTLDSNPSTEGGQFEFDSFFRQIATGTGFGFRYDLDFFIIRFDVGIALHVPYETGKSGYYNIPKFKDGLGFHFAIGYPF